MLKLYVVFVETIKVDSELKGCNEMRVKISTKDYEIEKLQFGKRYFLAYAGVTYGESFVFTRKNKVELFEVVYNKKVSSRWVSKRELKQLINSGAIHWMCIY